MRKDKGSSLIGRHELDIIAEEVINMTTKKRYWARYFIGGEWGIWHLIGSFDTHGKAYWQAQQGTRLLYKEIELTTDEPKTYAGKA